MKQLLSKMLNHEKLTRHEMLDILIGITEEKYPTEQIAALVKKDIEEIVK